MKIAVGSDERTHLTDTVVEELRKRGHDLVLFGPLAENDPDSDWPYTSSKTAEAVATGRADEGIVFCWTGTGASIAHASGTMPTSSPSACVPPQRLWPGRSWKPGSPRLILTMSGTASRSSVFINWRNARRRNGKGVVKCARH